MRWRSSRRRAAHAGLSHESLDRQYPGWRRETPPPPFVPAEGDSGRIRRASITPNQDTMNARHEGEKRVPTCTRPPKIAIHRPRMVISASTLALRERVEATYQRMSNSGRIGRSDARLSAD